MKIGFTGTQAGMTPKQRVMLISIFRDVQPTEFHHGDCIGADLEAHNIAREFSIPIVIHPPDNESKRAFCSGFLEIREPRSYLNRNMDIVVESDMLIATPKEHIEQLRSGTWSTIRRARKQGKSVVIINPDGTTG